MPRGKFQTLTEPMFYTLLCLQEECCGTDIMGRIDQMTDGRVRVGPGTLYNLLDQFLKAQLIEEIGAFGRRRNYILTSEGRRLLREEFERIQKQAADYLRVFGEESKGC